MFKVVRISVLSTVGMFQLNLILKIYRNSRARYLKSLNVNVIIESCNKFNSLNSEVFERISFFLSFSLVTTCINNIKLTDFYTFI